MPPEKISIVLVGASKVGKSALVRALGGDLVGDEPFAHTVGTACSTYHFTAEQLGGAHDVQVLMCDIGGREGLRDLACAAREARGALVCYDLACPQTFAEAGRWLRCVRASIEARQARGASPDLPSMSAVLVGTKCDLNDAAVPAAAARFVTDQGLVCGLETSAKTGERVMTAFVALVADILRKDLELEQRHAQELAPVRPVIAGDPEVDVIQIGAGGYELLLPVPKRLSTCLATGLWHRAAHVWVFDTDRRALVVQRRCPTELTYSGLNAPSACGAVAREYSTDAARSFAQRQLGLKIAAPDDDEDVDACRPPVLDLLTTVLVTSALPARTATLVGGAGPMQAVVDLYLVEVCNARLESEGTGDVALLGERPGALRMVAYEDVLEALRSDPSFIKPSKKYIDCLRRGIEKRWVNPLANALPS